MDLDEACAVIRGQPTAVPATPRADGTPQMSPVAVAVAVDRAGPDRAGPDRTG